MRFNPFTHHRLLTNVVIALFVIAFLLSAQAGELKPLADIAWLDILGEGGIVLMTLTWIAALLISRPPSKVTTFLVLGLGLFMFSASLDLFDEWLHQPTNTWLTWIESLPAPIGMIFTSIGLYQWHKEQYVLNRQLKRREAMHREHELVCSITGLYKANYLQNVLKDQLTVPQPLQLAAIDIRDFSNFNAEFGFMEGDRLLSEVSELVLMNCRLSDVLCRYAGDCFMVLMPNTTEQQGKELVTQIVAALTHCAFKVEGAKQAKFQHVSSALVSRKQDDSAHSLSARLHTQLQQQKQQRVSHSEAVS
ncbi:GGDEF domain-containing protein [Pseudoalteromonas sp. CO302Y]|uniref:GGDEF domain-containing protein n=1 Tax=unclassified Pseudoalteromonas TaxID=194690 RepID=UPI001023D9A4|nr:GGDEF domain-containing protein [Pseudoalteromonas sp. CO302Y]RZG07982.1 GGDEF domain-containing protein [Pseudoalteromonas sp. CO133X]